MVNIPGLSIIHEEYSGTTFEIEAGCVLAVGKQVNATIAKEMEDLARSAVVIMKSRITIPGNILSRNNKRAYL